METDAASAKKRKRLQEIEDEAVQRTDADKLEALYKDYMLEYQGEQGGQKRRTEVPDTPMEADTGGASPSSGRSGTSAWRKRVSEMPIELEADIGQIIAKLHEELDQMAEVKRIIEQTDGRWAWDDVNDMELPLDKVEEARQEEMDHMKGKTFKVVKKKESYDKTGKAPISTRWVDTDKTHGEGEMLVRSRWVARDFKTKGERDREDLFCATPPLELLRFLVSKAATRSRRSSGRRRKMLFIDLKKAHLIPKCEEDVFVELPKESGCSGDECETLIYWLYVCRRTGQAWQDHYSSVLVKAGFVRGQASPVTFFHRQRDLWCVVHGDDFTYTGYDKDLDWVADLAKKEYEIKVRGKLGPDANDVKSIDILGRLIKYEEWGLSWSADPRHRKMIMEHFGFGPETKVLTRTGNKEDDKGGSESVVMGKEEARHFRGVTARTNYMAADCPQVQYATKEVCRHMANPTEAAHESMKKLARYIVGCEETVFEYKWQDEEEAKLQTFTDSDWAGCTRTRRSTSGGAIVMGSHTLKTWSSTQPVVAMSAAEAEYYAMVEGETRAIGLKTMLGEMGVEVSVIVISTDSSSAKSFASKRLGKMRHIEVKELWLQEAVCRGRIKLYKIPGTENRADLFTKYLPQDEVFSHLRRLGIRLKWKGSDPPGS